LAACIEIARNDFTQEIAEEAGIGDFRMKSCSNEAFTGVLVTFRRAAAAIPKFRVFCGLAAREKCPAPERRSKSS
jgi:hypothetical protein